jgi:tetratricopeptide (TPR) repeat protein
VQDTRAADMARAAKAGMGGVARKGAAQLRAPGMAQAKVDRGAPKHDTPDEWIDEGSIASAAASAVAASRSTDPTDPTDRSDRTIRLTRRRPKRLPEEVVEEIGIAAGPRRAPQLAEKLGEAVTAFDADRYNEARAILAKLATSAPAAAAVRELHGLALYRMERWRQAAAELEAYHTLTGEVDQHPVLADCYRAQRKHDRVDELWVELRQASPSAEVVAEGRIVTAGSLADRKRLDEAIALLERSLKATRRVGVHHLRQWYALADLYDRAGDSPRARSLFRRIRDLDGAFADTAERLKTLGR